MSRLVFRTIDATLIGLFIAIFIIPWLALSQEPGQFPRLANYYLRWELTESEVKELSKWDLVILDMETQVNSPELLKELKRLNPHIILLAYITPQEIRTDAAHSTSVMRKKLAAQIPEAWYLMDTNNQRLSNWPGTYVLNMADNAPLVNGERWNAALARFVHNEIAFTGLWDGVFYDNTWDGISWFAGSKVDLDHDGVPSTDVDAHWQAGMHFLFAETRRLSGDSFLVVGNGGTSVYKDDLNGILLENFPNHNGWKGTMQLYSLYENGSRTPHVIVINRTTLNSGRQDDYQSMRFGLTSSLLGSNGYYSFDYGDQNHGQTWWYDEYNVHLGKPAGVAQSLNQAPAFGEDVWRRDYDRGAVLVNATDKEQQIDLGGEYEKIIGTQDKAVNDGSIVTQVTLPAHDGLIMLKTFKTLSEVWFTNGGFARFYRVNGARARNGFFAFEDQFPGGAEIYNGDLNGDGNIEKIVATGPKLEIFNSQGDHWFNDYPFGADFKGTLQVAVGRLRSKGEKQIIVAPSRGGEIKIYDYHGGIIADKIYPLGKKYGGGFSVAIGTDFNHLPVVALGSAGSHGSIISLFDVSFSKLQRRWYPFGSRYRGPLSITIGNFEGRDTQDEIAVAPQARSTPSIDVFNQRGKRLTHFILKGFLGDGQTVTLGAADVSFEGKKQIVVMGAN